MGNWNQYARKLYKIEQSYYPNILRALKKVYSSFTSNLEQHGASYAQNRLNLQALNDDILPLINKLYRDVGLWGAKTTFAELRSTEGQKSAGFGRNEKWIAEVENYLRLKGLEFVQSISETTREDILKILQRGVSEGKSIAEIARELRATGIVQARAQTIARTEVIRAANVGHVIGAKSFPYEVTKKWSAARDHRTRHSHREVHNHVVDEFGAFIVPIYADKEGKKLIGYDKMMFPCDPNASARNTINCRCRVIHEPKRDANGRLVLRTHTPTTISPATSTIAQAAATLLGFGLAELLND